MTAAREHGSDQGSDHSLDDERRLDEPVRRADQAHDPEFPPPRKGRKPDGRGDEQHRRDEHQRRDADRGEAGGAQSGEDRFQVVPLVHDLIDARLPGEGLDEDVRLVGSFMFTQKVSGRNSGVTKSGGLAARELLLVLGVGLLVVLELEALHQVFSGGVAS